MNNEDKGYMIYCPRCGAEMNSKSRYCMKCGYLNTEHEANEGMKPYIKDNTESYQVGSGTIMTNNGISNVIGNNTGNRKLCFIVNIVSYLLIMIISYIITTSFSFDILVIRDSMFPILAIIVSIVFLYIYSIELIFMKCNKPWWSGLIPIYNFMMLSEVLYKNKLLGLITLIPIVGQIYVLVVFYTIGKRFKKSGLLTALLSFIFIPIIGLGSSLYLGKTYMDNLDPKEIEYDYSRKKVFLFFTMLFFLIGTGFTVWKNMDTVEEGTELLGNAYYAYAADKIVDKTKDKIKKDKIDCLSGHYYEDRGVYYFYYSDLGDYIYLPLYYQREPIEGYVKVDNTNGHSKYYVTLTDGTYGFHDINIDNLTGDNVVKYKKIVLDKNNINVCYIK